MPPGTIARVNQDTDFDVVPVFALEHVILCIKRRPFAYHGAQPAT